MFWSLLTLFSNVAFSKRDILIGLFFGRVVGLTMNHLRDSYDVWQSFVHEIIAFVSNKSSQVLTL